MDRKVKEVLLELLAERDMSLRELARRWKRRFGRGSVTQLSFMKNRKVSLTVRNLEEIASVLEVSPTAFAEYRMARMRESLDPEKAGFGSAATALGVHEAALENFLKTI